MPAVDMLMLRNDYKLGSEQFNPLNVVVMRRPTKKLQTLHMFFLVADTHTSKTVGNYYGRNYEKITITNSILPLMNLTCYL